MKKHPVASVPALVTRNDICSFLSEQLSLKTISDYSCNGLQVEGCPAISRIGLAVDACMKTYAMAVDASCEMLFVHHGIIWGGLQSITGTANKQLRFLLKNNLNLYAVHLPLDLHPSLGNNACLARLVGIIRPSPFGFYKGMQIGFSGALRSTITRDTLVEKLCRSLDTSCIVLPFGAERIRTIGIVSGGGSDALAEAIERGLDCFVTGEPSHENYHLALEAGINVIYAGHYHTEKGGVMAVGKLLEKTFGVKTIFLDVPTYI